MTQIQPYFSIITINRNNALGLEKTIASVISQTFDDFEYIIIDGASTDNSVDIINQYHNNVTNYISEPDLGIYNAMNKGIKFSRGLYCIFINSGDMLYSKNTLQDIFNLKRNEDLIFGNVIIQKNEISSFIATSPDIISFDFLFTTSLHHPSSIIKRELLLIAGLYNEEYKYVSDWSFFVDAIFKYNCSYHHINLLVAIFNTDGVSSQKENIEKINNERKSHLFNNYKNMYISLSNRFKHKTIVFALEHPNNKFLLFCTNLTDKLLTIKNKLKKLNINY